MYEIYKFKLYETDTAETLIATPIQDGMQILTGETDLAVNEAGSFTFKLAPNHAYYGTLEKLSDGIRLRVDDWKNLYYRVLDVSYDFWKNEVVTCEGLLVMLNDWLCLPYRVDVENNLVYRSNFDGYTATNTLTLANIISGIIGSSVSEQAPITTDTYPTISVTEPSEKAELAKLSGGGTHILDELLDIIDRFGGFVYIKRVTQSDSSGLSVSFAFTQDAAPGKTCTQTIEYGVNLMDITVHDNAGDIYTSCVGVGEEVTDAVEENMWGDAGRMTAQDYSGHIYVDASNALVKKYGRRIVYKQFDGLNTPYRIYCAAYRYILQLVAEQMSFEIKAIDLRSLDGTSDGFCCGDLVPVKSTPHGIDGTYLCSQAHIDLTDISRTYYTFGGKTKTISSMTARR